MRMLKAIYSDVRAYIRTSKGLTNTVTCPVGVRQGCIISPIIFTLFLNDLQEYTCISVGSNGIDIETIKLFVLLFADDLVIFAETVRRQKHFLQLRKILLELEMSKLTYF